MEEITIEKWKYLGELLYNFPETPFNRFRSDFVYRGLADASWDLRSSLIRLGGEFDILEEPLLRSFRKYSKPGSVPSDSIWVRLAVAQHHGLPTRVLDWTSSPRIAVHFATAEEEYYDRDAAIWCVNADKVRNLLPERLRETLRRKCAYMFSVEMLDELIPSLEELDRMGENGPFALFFEPPSIDARVANQQAVLSVLSGSRLILNDVLETVPGLVKRFVIPKKLKWEIRDKLDQDNVTERMLFPGLDGLCTWLKRYYGPGPNRQL